MNSLGLWKQLKLNTQVKTTIWAIRNKKRCFLYRSNPKNLNCCTDSLPATKNLKTKTILNN